MKKILFAGGVLCSLVCIVSCVNNIADDVYSRQDPPQNEKNSSLTVEVLDEDGRTGLIVGALSESLFDEQGTAGNVTESELLLSAPVEGGKAMFEDLMDYYRTTLYFNVFEHSGDELKPVTHLGNQLQYQVVFGDITKTVDLSAEPVETVRKTEITITVASEYSEKNVYFTDEAKSQKLKESIMAGEEVPVDLYLATARAGDEPIVITIDSPKNTGKYFAYIEAPEDEVACLVREIEIGYDTEEVQIDFAKEQPKRIQVTAIYLEGTQEPYTETPLHGKEVYLIAADKWEQVKEHVDKDKGNPETGTYVLKGTIEEGTAVFEVFCTEGQQDYVVYVPKWNTDYYDSYQYKEVSVSADTDEYAVDIKALFTPPGSGEAGITKTVVFTVKINAYPSGWRAMGAIYAVADSEYLKELYNYSQNSFGGTPPDVEFAKSGDISYSSLPIEETIELEINTSKEIAFFVNGIDMMTFSPSSLVARVNGSEITGNTCEVILSDIEHL